MAALHPPNSEAAAPAPKKWRRVGFMSCTLMSDSLDRAVEQFDRHALRTADEADARARPHRGRLAGELDALGLEVRRDGVDAGDRKPEVVEALIRRGRRRIDAVARLDRREEHVGAADLHVDARRALLHRAADFG